MVDISNRAVWLYREPIDFRKQVNGLVQLIIEDKGHRPNDGALYVFRNQQGNRLKVIFWHRNGFFLGYKRLELGRFSAAEAAEVELNTDELQDLILGVPMIAMGKDGHKKVHLS
jgi:transposase